LSWGGLAQNYGCTLTNGIPPTIREPNAGPCPKMLKYILKTYAGQSTINNDNVFGSATTQAVRNVQSIFALTTDGVVGPTTWGAVRLIYDQATAPTKYVFPVGPRTKSGNPGAPATPQLSALPCNYCHGPSPAGSAAIDIGRRPGGDASTGAAVFAISNGKIGYKNEHNGAGCWSLQIHSVDSFWYYYDHIQNVTVANGQNVSAGQKIAEIGPRRCTGNGSNPHLHIDRGCVRNAVPQIGGYDNCRDPGMIPLINSLWLWLPG